MHTRQEVVHTEVGHGDTQEGKGDVGLVHEADIRQVAKELHFTKQKALCPYEETTRRSDMQAVFQQLEQLNPEARYSLWRSVFME